MPEDAGRRLSRSSATSTSGCFFGSMFPFRKKWLSAGEDIEGTGMSSRQPEDSFVRQRCLGLVSLARWMSVV